jgi:hypothetical protein
VLDLSTSEKLDQIQKAVAALGTLLGTQSEQIRALAAALNGLVETLTAAGEPREGGRSLHDLLADLVGQIELQNRQLHELTQVQVAATQKLPNLVAEAVVKAMLEIR